MKYLYLLFFICISCFSLASSVFSPPHFQGNKRYFAMAIANYSYMNIGDDVNLEFKLNYDKKYIGEIFWDKISQKTGRVSDHFGIGFGYTIPGISTRTDLKARVFYSKAYGLGLGARPALRFVFADNFVLQAGPDINYDKKGLSIGLYGGVGIGVAF